jgi:4-amino-4-deoxy-L-arabinose transferase-like glycosyltransferase
MNRAGLIAAAIVLAGMALRMVRLDGQSLWFDEAYAITVSGLPFGELVDALVADVRQAPLHFLALAGWLELFGIGAPGVPGVIEARWLSVLASTAGIGFAWLLARRLFGTSVATLTAAFLAVAQLDVLYAQEARMYALLACLTSAGSWLFAAAVLDTRRPGAWWGSILLAALAIATHYYAVLVVVAWCAFAFSVRKKHPVPLARWLIGAPLLGGLLAPWWILGAARQAERLALVLPDRLASWFAVDGATAFRTVNELNGGQLPAIHEAPAWWAWLLGALLFSAPALVAALAGRRDEETRYATRFCVLLVLVPLAAALILGWLFHFQYATRYVLPCLVPYLVLVARGLSMVRSPALRVGAICAALAWSLGGVFVTLGTVHKVQWREAIEHVAAGYESGDRCVFLPGGAPPLEWGIYRPELDPRALRLEDVEADACPRVWLVSFERTPAHAEETIRAQRLLSREFTSTDGVDLFRVRVTLFERR